MRSYKIKWKAEGTMTVEAESKADAIELAEIVLHDDLIANDVEDFEVKTAVAG